MSAATSAAPVPAMPRGGVPAAMHCALPFVERLPTQPRLPVILGGAALVAAHIRRSSWRGLRPRGVVARGRKKVVVLDESSFQVQ